MIYHVEAAAVVPPANPLVPAWPELIIGTISFLIVFAVALLYVHTLRQEAVV